MSTSLLRRSAVIEQTGLSVTELYRRIANGSFPAPIRISGSRVSVWPSTDVDAWIAEQLTAAGRGTPNPTETN